jgi:hypothetical protein
LLLWAHCAAKARCSAIQRVWTSALRHESFSEGCLFKEKKCRMDGEESSAHNPPISQNFAQFSPALL